MTAPINYKQGYNDRAFGECWVLMSPDGYALLQEAEEQTIKDIEESSSDYDGTVIEFLKNTVEGKTILNIYLAFIIDVINQDIENSSYSVWDSELEDYLVVGELLEIRLAPVYYEQTGISDLPKRFWVLDFNVYVKVNDKFGEYNTFSSEICAEDAITIFEEDKEKATFERLPDFPPTSKGPLLPFLSLR